MRLIFARSLSFHAWDKWATDAATILRCGACIRLVRYWAKVKRPAAAAPSGNTPVMITVSATDARLKTSVPPQTNNVSVKIFWKKRLVTLLIENVKLILPVAKR